MTMTWPAGDSPSEMNDAFRHAMAREHAPESVRFSDQIKLSVLPGLRQLIQRAAMSAGMKSTDFHRKAIDDALRAAGIDPAELVRSRSAGQLYDVIEGRRMFALVSGGRVIAQTSRLDAAPDLSDVNHHPAGYVPADGDAWLPIAFEDSEPFDAAVHHRGSWQLRIEPDRVVREYSVIPRECE